MKFNVILPAAGDGTRLELPYPKELHALEKGGCLIDRSMSLLLPHKEDVASVTVVLKKGKFAVADYLSRYRADFHMRFVFFNENYKEWPGSILSAEPDFGEANIVLLPDTIIEFEEGQDLIELYTDMLTSHAVGFTLARPGPEGIGRFGALHLDDRNEITAFCDKPQASHETYNGYWTSFGFRREVGRKLLTMMQASIGGHPKDISAEAAPAAGRFIAGYRDLGVWPEMSRYLVELHNG